jgi:hypothetical protein
MSFYSDFAGYYEAVFPFEEGVFSFLRENAPPGRWLLQVVNWDFILKRASYRFSDIVLHDGRQFDPNVESSSVYVFESRS